MADISKLKTPDGTTYSLKDETARAGLAGKAAASHKQAFTSSECTSFTSDDNTMGTTPAAVKKAIGMFEPKSHTHTKSQITDFPTSLPANGGNADTINGRHCGRIATLTQDGKYWDANAENINDAYLQWDGSTYFKLRTFGGNLTAVDYATNADTLGGKSKADFVEGLLNLGYSFSMVFGDHSYITNNIDNNVPNLPAVANFMHIIGRNSEGKVMVALSVGKDYTRNVYTYSADNAQWNNLCGKPYTTGTVSLAANATKCTVSFGFTPSLVLWSDPTNTAVFNSLPYSVYIAAAFDSTSFTVGTSNSSARSISYIAFR